LPFFEPQNPPEADRSDYFIILRFLFLLFDLPTIASRSGEAGKYSLV
jgi:hypothetical protein